MSVHGSELERLQQDLTESERQRETLRHLLLGMVERIDADSLISLDEWEKLAETGTKAIHSQQTFLEYLEGDAVPDTYTGCESRWSACWRGGALRRRWKHFAGSWVSDARSRRARCGSRSTRIWIGIVKPYSNG